MRRSALHALTVTALIGLAACGEAPPVEATSADIAAPGPGLQQVSFTGVGDPATGRLQIFMGPQASIGTITEDKDGSAATVTADTAQVYGPTRSPSSPRAASGYPAGCSNTAALGMVANVEVFSGFKEQLRNVYARITSVSGGQTFCTRATPGGHRAARSAPTPGSTSTSRSTAGTSPSAIKRSGPVGPEPARQWRPSGSAATLCAEVIPAPPDLRRAGGQPRHPICHAQAPASPSPGPTIRGPTEGPRANGYRRGAPERRRLPDRYAMRERRDCCRAHRLRSGALPSRRPTTPTDPSTGEPQATGLATPGDSGTSGHSRAPSSCPERGPPGLLEARS